jgi:RNA polymerase sigma factor (sigma-70 family)
MNTTAALHYSSATDVELVAESQRGSRDAFARIVARYQSLICSVGYSLTGSLSRSEDVAQETFLSAWRQLDGLREPASLRAWLCGIARNLANNAARRDAHEPAHAADPIESTLDTAAAEPAPQEQAIGEEEQAILWRAIAHIPATYREPLVLYYREQQSIEAVCAALDLSEDAVKQRLSRGRKLLHERIAVFVEGALARSGPGTAFTLAVVAALPSTSSTAAAAAVGATAAKGGALAKWAAFAAICNALLSTIFGFAGTYLFYRMSLEGSLTELQRARLRREMRGIALGLVFFLPALVAFVQAGPFWAEHEGLFLAAGIGLPTMFGLWIIRAILRSMRSRSALREAECIARPDLFAHGGAGDTGFGEYRSKTTLFGLPLLHVQFGVLPRDAGPARGWIAVGTGHSRGILFAMGATSCGIISVGALSVGVVAVGSVSIAPVSLATIALGWIAFGGIAIGDFALGGFAAGWTGATGGLAVAHDAARGGYAIAAHANDAIAGSLLRSYHFDLFLPAGIAATALLLGVPGLAYLFSVRRWRRRAEAALRARGPAAQPQADGEQG